MQMIAGAIVTLAGAMIIALSGSISDQKIAVGFLLGIMGLVVLFSGMGRSPSS